MKKLTQTWKVYACEKAKASLEICQGEYGENKLDRMPKDLESEKESSDDYHAIEKAKSKRAEEQWNSNENNICQKNQ